MQAVFSGIPALNKSHTIIMTHKELNPRFPDLEVPSQPTLMEIFVFKFLKHYLENKTPFFHRQIYWILQNPKIYNRALMLAPRGFAKSVIVCIFFPLFIIYILTNPKHAGDNYRKIKSILIITASKELGMNWLSKIKYEIQNNEILLNAFGDLSTEGEKNGLWQSDGIKVRSSSGDIIEINVIGRGSRARGPHPDIIIQDDLEDDESAVSDTQCRTITAWLKTAIEGMLRKKNCNFYWIGTVIAPECVIDNAYKKKGWAESWFRIKWGAYKKDGSSIWPDAFSIEFLAEKEKEMGWDKFAAEYLNNPVVSTDPIFRRKHFKFFEEIDLPTNLHKITAIDPALKEREIHDFTGIVTIGVCMTGKKRMNIYVLNFEEGKWNSDGKSKRIYEEYSLFHPADVLVETSAQQEYFKDILVMKARDEGFYLPIREVKPFKDKVTRTKAIAHLVEQGYVYFRKNQERLMEQLEMFPFGKNDDLVDAFQMCLEKAKSLQNRISSEETSDYEEVESAIPELGYY